MDIGGAAWWRLEEHSISINTPRNHNEIPGGGVKFWYGGLDALLYNYGIAASEGGDGADRDPNGREDYADNAQGERDLEENFARLTLDGDLARVAVLDDLLDLLEEIVAGDFVLFGFR